jgi:hypothetical protein
MNKNNILVSAVVILLLVSGIPMISYPVKADTPDVSIKASIRCTTKPIKQDDIELFKAPLYNNEGYDVYIDIRWYYDGYMERPPVYNFKVPAYANVIWTPEEDIEWLAGWLTWKNVTCEILLNSTHELLDTQNNWFVQWRPFWFHYNEEDYDGTPELWTYYPANMADSSAASFAYTQTVADREDLVGNNCTGSGSGNITEVYMRVKGYYSNNKHTIILKPVFNGAAVGGSYEFENITTTATWSPWFNITGDRCAPNPWNWYDIENLDCQVIADGPLNPFTLYCSEVEIYVGTDG